MRCAAATCPHCRRESPAWTLKDDEWWAKLDDVWYWLDERQNMWRTADEEYWAGAWWRVVEGVSYRQSDDGTWDPAERGV